jgi:hypothetical protein
MLIFGGTTIMFDVNQLFRFSNSPSELFSRCYFYRQVCDIINGDGFFSKVFHWMLNCNALGALFALLFACMQLYTVAMFIQGGFAFSNTVLSGESNSLLTENSEVTSFKVSLASATLSTFITYVFFLLFVKWRYRFVIFRNAKYSCVLLLFSCIEILLSLSSIVLGWFSLEITPQQYVFLLIKAGLLLFNVHCLWRHRPCGDSDDMLYFGTCDSKVCVAQNQINP